MRSGNLCLGGISVSDHDASAMCPKGMLSTTFAAARATVAHQPPRLARWP